ncbi:MAG TPA: hypothetical protein VFA18_01755 [Gemmataceae bacterium]|nr:hypothetical protein [Gemmataceae bacterium]
MLWTDRLGIALLASLLATTALAQGDATTYEFRQDLRPYYGVRRGNMFVVGHLDAAGNFIPEPRMHWLPTHGTYSLPQFDWLYRAHRPDEPVYEFRSARLIKGVLKDGSFVPDKGVKVIDFKDYRYRKGALRIYNLPGHFVKTNE